MTTRTRSASRKRTRPPGLVDTQLSMIASGPVLAANSVDPFAVPGDGQRQPSAALLVPGLRAAVNAWRAADYPGASETTRRLLAWWFEEEHPLRGGGRFRYYFAQREAIETLIYCHEVLGTRSFRDLLERDEENIHCSYDREGNLETYRRADMGPTVSLPYDPNEDRLPRYVCKLATGGGKTKVMALAIVWSYFHRLYEPDSTLARNFLLIAPNLIVFERLRSDFGSAAIFRKDPLIPREWAADFDMQVALQDEAAPPSATGMLYLTNIHRLYPDKPDDPVNAVQALIGVPVKKDRRAGSTEELIERVSRHDDLIVLNDEAHHIHDEKLAWSRVIGDIHGRLTERGLPGLAAQLDFSATPKHNDGVLFREIISDYPLADAIAAGIVKQPLLGELSDPQEVPSDDASVRFRQWIDAGVARLKDYEALHEAAGKRPLLFVMAGDTDEADQIAAYLDSLDGFKDRVLTIHTNRRGEIAESASGKARDELEKLRQASREVDSDENPYRAIVSVLMLREGWDVRNVTVVVGLRAYSAASGILPEQTVGRGLRLMYGGGSGATEQVDIIGAAGFQEFIARELKQSDNVEFKRRKVDVPLEGRTVAVLPPRVPQYDIVIPQLSNLLRRSPEAISRIDVAAFGKRLMLLESAPDETQDYVLRDALTEEVQRELQLVLPLPANAQGILWYYAKRICKDARADALFDRVVGMVKRYLAEVAFGRRVDLDDRLVWWSLMADHARETVVRTFVSAINQAMKEEATVEIREPERRASQTAAFVWSKAVYEGQKTVFNLVPVDSSLESALAEFLDRADDVAAYAKNTNKLGLTLDYQSEKGHIRLYQPDFLVRLTNGDHWLVETKGLQDLDVARKDQRARIWCRDASELTADGANPQRWQYVKILQDTFEDHRNRTFAGLASHATAAGSSLSLPG